MITDSKYLWLVLLLGFILIGSAHAGEPLDVVKGAADRAVQILKDPKLLSKDKKKERVELLRGAVEPIFDFEEMAKRSLGPHWRRRTPAEQQEFVKLFQDFMEKVYSDKLDLYEGEKIVFGKETIDQDFAQVESTIINNKGETFSIVYKLRRADTKWKVYDAVVENISFINNYRSQFDRVIKSSSYEELVKRLREKSG
ncbi:MAG TPA: ABC transporter substrate-binding protein [Candidatus Acidoferrales bacterium]|nr:ABC transporter substrate-binding protein [Candidatus Acidoferrales bacterium]